MSLGISNALTVVQQAGRTVIKLPSHYPTFSKLLRACRNDSNTIRRVTTSTPARLGGQFSPTGKLAIGGGACGMVRLGTRIAYTGDILKSSDRDPGYRIAIPVAVKEFDLTCEAKQIAAILEGDALRTIMRNPHPYVQQPLETSEKYVVSKMARTDLAHYRETGKMPNQEFFKIAGQVGEGVAHLHKLGYLHLDLKFGNILINARGDAEVADIGGNTAETVKLYGVVGRLTPEGDAAAGTHSDVFGLAALVYEHFVDAKFYDKSLGGLEYYEKTVAPRSAHNALSAGLAERGIHNSPAATNLIEVLTQSLSIEPANRPSLPVLVNALRVMENQLNVADHTRRR